MARRTIPKPDPQPNPNPNVATDPRTGQRWVWVDGEPFTEEEVRQAAGFKERTPEYELEKRRAKEKDRGKGRKSAMSQIRGGRVDSLSGLTSDAGTGSLLGALRKFIAVK